jgi:hypothetical protein
MGAGANGALGTSEGFDGGHDHSTLVIAGVTTLGPFALGRVCARSRRAIGSRDGGPAHAEARTN